MAAEVRLCDDAFVWHKGKASFGDSGRALERENEKLLQAKHPEYGPEIARFCSTNPLAPFHREIQFHIPRQRAGACGSALFIVHASPFGPAPGGTEHHVRDLVRSLALPRAIIAYPLERDLVAAEVLDGRSESATIYKFPLSSAPDRFCVSHPEVEAVLRRWVDIFGVRWAHIHHLMFWPVSVGRVLRDAAVPYIYTVHDYYCVSPNWNLFDFSKSTLCDCGAPDGKSAGCIGAFLDASSIPPDPEIDLARLRYAQQQAWLETLRGARAVVTPSSAARDVILRHLDLGGTPVQVVEHGYDAAPPASRKGPGERLRLGVLGEIAYPLKGAARYLELVKATAGLPIEWHFFGNVQRFGFGEALRALDLGDRIKFHGSYDRAEIVELLAAEGIDLCVLLPQWDETFSYTMSEALLAGAPVLVSDRGALAERVRRDGTGVIVSSTNDAVEILTRFSSNRTSMEPFIARVRKLRYRTVAENGVEYRALFSSLGFGFALDAQLRSEWLRDLADRAEKPPAGSLGTANRRANGMPSLSVGLGSEVLSALSAQPILVLNSAVQGTPVNLRMVQKSESTVLFEAESADPRLIFNVQIDTANVNEFRFFLRRENAGVAHAQLFWSTAGDAGFSEERSSLVYLDGPAGEWREYRLRLDSSDLAPVWRRGDVLHLRFDPIDRPGVIELGRLELHA